MKRLHKTIAAACITGGAAIVATVVGAAISVLWNEPFQIELDLSDAALRLDSKPSEPPRENDGEKLQDPMQTDQWADVVGSGIEMARYETTNREFAVFLEATGASIPNFERRVSRHPDHPVTRVSWDDAVRYCEWLTRRDGDQKYQYRLPSVREWELGAKGSSKKFYWQGDSLDEAQVHVANRNGPRAVKSFRDISSSGIEDLAGNVSEWCAEDHCPSSFDRPVMGGSYQSTLEMLNSGQVLRCFRRDAKDSEIGFRVARSLKP